MAMLTLVDFAEEDDAWKARLRVVWDGGVEEEDPLRAGLAGVGCREWGNAGRVGLE